MQLRGGQIQSVGGLLCICYIGIVVRPQTAWLYHSEKCLAALLGVTCRPTGRSLGLHVEVLVVFSVRLIVERSNKLKLHGRLMLDSNRQSP